MPKRIQSIWGNSKLSHCLAVLVALIPMALPSTATAASCYNIAPKTACKCINCTYWIVCGGSIGIPPGIRLETCTGTNPGFVAADALSATNGYYDYRLSVGFCGKAIPVGRCCGGARTTIEDGGVYSTATLVGPGCGLGGTGI